MEQDMEQTKLIARHREYWREEDGPALWWRFPVGEPPYAGTPLDDDCPDYVTHWTPIDVPDAPECDHCDRAATRLDEDPLMEEIHGDTAYAHFCCDRPECIECHEDALYQSSMEI